MTDNYMFNTMRAGFPGSDLNKACAHLEFIGLACRLNFQNEYTGDIHESTLNEYYIDNFNQRIFVRLAPTAKGGYSFVHKISGLNKMADLFLENGLLTEKSGFGPGPFDEGAFDLEKDGAVCVKGEAVYKNDKGMIEACFMINENGQDMYQGLLQTATAVYGQVANDLKLPVLV